MGSGAARRYRTFIYMSCRGEPGAIGGWVHRTWLDWKLWNDPSMRTKPRLPTSSAGLLNCSVGASMRLHPRSADPRGVVTEVFTQPRPNAAICDFHNDGPTPCEEANRRIFIDLLL